MEFRFGFSRGNTRISARRSPAFDEIKPISTRQNSLLKKLCVRKYQDILHESKAIADFIKKTKNGILITDDKNLMITVNQMLSFSTQKNELLLKDFLIKTSFCLFNLNKSKYIDLCSSHPFCSDEFKGISKVSSFRLNSSRALEESGITSVCYKRKYDSSCLLKAHLSFINKISNKKIDKIELKIDKEFLTLYEYLKIVKKELQTNYVFNDNLNQIFSLKNISSIPLTCPIWIGGLSDECFLSLEQLESISLLDDAILSYSCIKNSYKTSLNSLLKDFEEISFEEKHETIKYEYTDPKPPLKIRKNSFAINHITKLLNNPYQFYIEGILNIKQHSFHQNHTIGILIHAVFEECIKNNPLFESLDEMNEKIEEIIKSKNLSKIDEMIVSKKIYLMSKTLWPIIKDAERLYPEKEGIQEINHNGKTYLLHGRADLIYKNKDGSYGVIDFKTGSIPSWINIINGSAPQISVEILMLKFGGFIDEDDIKITKSGFIWPKGFLEVKEEDVIDSSIDGIKKLIETFWAEEAPYTYTNDSQYRVTARDFSNEVN